MKNFFGLTWQPKSPSVRATMTVGYISDTSGLFHSGLKLAQHRRVVSTFPFPLTTESVAEPFRLRHLSARSRLLEIEGRRSGLDCGYRKRRTPYRHRLYRGRTRPDGREPRGPDRFSDLSPEAQLRQFNADGLPLRSTAA